ncbi:hypothetical protein AB837_00462 [bacterium AB1]|nr:hypothetical protein AB837_00462 [bacterium AB1]
MKDSELKKCKDIEEIQKYAEEKLEELKQIQTKHGKFETFYEIEHNIILYQKINTSKTKDDFISIHENENGKSIVKFNDFFLTDLKTFQEQDGYEKLQREVLDKTWYLKMSLLKHHAKSLANGIENLKRLLTARENNVIKITFSDRYEERFKEILYEMDENNQSHEQEHHQHKVYFVRMFNEEYGFANYCSENFLYTKPLTRNYVLCYDS